jgi:quercetin dioxygenase-like cupin family protein
MNIATESMSDAADELWFGNTLIAIRLASAAGQDGICVIEHRAPHGDSPPLHVHRNEDEVFHIIEGNLRFRVDGRDRVAGAGDVLVAPKGIPHTYRIESADGARFLTITRGSDLETMLRGASRPALHHGLPEPAEPTAEMIEALVGLAAANGIDIVGAPLA